MPESLPEAPAEMTGAAEPAGQADIEHRSFRVRKDFPVTLPQAAIQKILPERFTRSGKQFVDVPHGDPKLTGRHSRRHRPIPAIPGDVTPDQIQMLIGQRVWQVA